MRNLAIVCFCSFLFFASGSSAFARRCWNGYSNGAWTRALGGAYGFGGGGYNNGWRAYGNGFGNGFGIGNGNWTGYGNNGWRGHRHHHRRSWW
ncbi:MAG: hypothetical protein K2X27_20930 [Candidatus Obscuribacterales bacterium]|nr:hypothetical protein [Candidatus Obscuribacterales bacterium]